MPSPFPGMDPYLEGELWSPFHAQFAVKIADALNPKLTPRYVAFPEKYQNAAAPEEIGITFGAESMRPDVAVLWAGGKKPRKPTAEVGTLIAPLTLDTVVTIPVNHYWVKILDMERRLLVTAIELLSPTNKRGQSRKKYLKKRRNLLLSQTHLLEIDLLRTGHRVPMVEPLPDAAYFVFLSRAGHRPRTQVWPVPLDQPLPNVPVPLLPGDADVDLDLQEVLNRVYDLGGMEYAIDYRKPPAVGLPPDWARWAEHLLRDAGKRSRGKERKT